MMDTNTEKKVFSTKIDVHISYINYGDHLGNDSFISIIHEARIRFLNSLGCTEKDIEGTGIIQKNLYVDYLKQVYYGDVLTVDTSISELNKASMKLAYNLFNKNNEHVLFSETLIVFYDYERNKIVKTPKLLFDLWESN